MLVVVEKTREEIVLEGEPLARGGEALVYPLPAASNLLVKVYHKSTVEHGEKLAAMITAPPDDPMLARGHVSIAWPIDRVLTGDAEHRCVGYLMGRVDKARPIIEFYNPRSRMQLCPHFHYGYLLRTARNLAAAVRAVHERGYVIGDVNESNILTTTQALITLVDTDSFQVRVGNRIHRCNVGKMEYTPPELQGARFADVDRSVEHDLFGLGVLLFQLLMQGMHPFAGVFTGEGEPGSVGRRITDGMWPYGRSRSIPYNPNPHAPPFEVLPVGVQEMMRLCFETGHHQPSARPDALSWQRALQEGEKELSTCAVNSQHVFPSTLKSCPWCEMARRHNRDPFPARTHVQKETRVNGHVTDIIPADEILEVLPADPLPIPPMPRTAVVEVAPLPDTIPMLTALPEVDPRRSSALPEFSPGLSTPATTRTRLNTEKIEGSPIVSRLPGNMATYLVSTGIGILILAVVFFFVLRKRASSEERGTFKGHTGPVNCVVCSSDGLALSGSSDGSIICWNVTREQPHFDPCHQEAAVSCIAFFPGESNRALSGGTDGKLHYWDLEAHREIWRPLIEGHEKEVAGVAFTPEGTKALSVSKDGTFRLWDIKNGANLSTSRPLNCELTCVAVAPDGKKIAIGTSTNEVQVWDLDRKKKLGSCFGHNEPVTAVAFSHDGKYIFSASEDETARMWDARAPFTQIRTFDGHTRIVTSLAVSSDGTRLLTGSRDRSVRLWDTQTAREEDRSYQHNGAVLCVAFTPGDSEALSGGEDKVLRKWQLPPRSAGRK